MKIVIDRDIPYIKGILEPYADISYLKGADISHDDILDADVIIVRTRTKCNQELLGGTKVKLIASTTIGYDHIDTAYCDKAGIKVVTATGSNARGVLQWIGATLAHTSAIQGWHPSEKVLGVVGVGHVGSLVTQYAAEWGFRVESCDPPRQRTEGTNNHAAKFISLEEIAKQCDIITFHTPLTRTGQEPTYHMADENFFAQLQPGTLIINSSRGEVIDTGSLIEAAGSVTCCLDTWENEPEIDKTLLALSILGTPHIAGYSAQGKANATSMIVQAIAREYGFPITKWYPENEVDKVTPSLISWNELRATIKDHFDIEKLSTMFKASSSNFEQMRNNYDYRDEYF